MAKKSSAAGGTSLVIVESPAKARTISKFLGRGYTIEASIGHIRDLPQGAKEIPEQYKKEDWAYLGVNVDHDFEPVYVIPREKSQQVRKLKSLLKDAKELYLATDEDREGEAISWHLCEVLRPKVPVHRLVFHEITEEAIREALENPRQIDEHLVRAQEVRRIVDRLYGYDVSPLLWRKIRPRLSAGRVQSVAVRLIVERERQRMAFVPATYWDLLGTFSHGQPDGEPFQAELVSVDDRRIPASRDFDPATGQLKDAGLLLLDGQAGRSSLQQRLRERPLVEVANLEDKPYTTRPYPPFTTSTLQQEANRKYGFTARHTMQVAQTLYETGHITYMRTDSTTLAAVAIEAARQLVASQYGDEYLPDSPRVYQTKVKNAQEAHEAIRPAGHPFDFPESLRGAAEPRRVQALRLDLEADGCQPDERCPRPPPDDHHRRRRRDVRGQRQDHRVSRLSAGLRGRLGRSGVGTGRPGRGVAGRVGGRNAPMHGHGAEEPHHPAAQSLQRGRAHPGAGGDGHRPAEHLRLDHRHHPGPRLRVQAQTRQRAGAHLDGLCRLPVARRAPAGIGRLPVHRRDGRRAGRHQPRRDESSRLPADVLFWQRTSGAEAVAGRQGRARSTPATCAASRSASRDGKGERAGEIFVRVGRYGPFLEQGDRRASLPDKLPPDELTLESALEMLDKAQQGDEPLGICPETHKPVFVKVGRFGPYVQRGTAATARRSRKTPRC